MYKLENCILPAYPKTLRSFLYLLVIVLELTVFSTAPFPSLLNTYLPLTSLCPWSPSNQQPKCGYLHTLHRAPGLRAEAEKRDFTVVSNYVYRVPDGGQRADSLTTRRRYFGCWRRLDFLSKLLHTPNCQKEWRETQCVFGIERDGRTLFISLGGYSTGQTKDLLPLSDVRFTSFVRY